MRVWKKRLQPGPSENKDTYLKGFNPLTITTIELLSQSTTVKNVM